MEPQNFKQCSLDNTLGKERYEKLPLNISGTQMPNFEYDLHYVLDHYINRICTSFYNFSLCESPD